MLKAFPSRILVVACATAACVARDRVVYVQRCDAPAIVRVTAAPPPPRVEVRSVAPRPRQVWIEGHWDWQGGSWGWNAGRWEDPRPGLAWVPPHYNGGQYRPGYWGRPGGRAPAPPAAPVVEAPRRPTPPVPDVRPTPARPSVPPVAIAPERPVAPGVRLEPIPPARVDPSTRPGVRPGASGGDARVEVGGGASVGGGPRLPTPRPGTRPGATAADARVEVGGGTSTGGGPRVPAPRPGGRPGATAADARVEVGGGASVGGPGGPEVTPAGTARCTGGPRPATGVVGSTFTLRGSGFGTDRTRVTVTVGAVGAAMRRLTDARIVAEVPPGTQGGEIAVRVGGASTTCGSFQIVEGRRPRDAHFPGRSH